MTTLLSIKARQGIPAPKDDREWLDYERERIARRQLNVKSAREILTRNGLYWTECRADYQKDGIVFYVAISQERWNDAETITYLPEVGRWYVGLVARFGCRNLVKYLKGGVI